MLLISKVDRNFDIHLFMSRYFEQLHKKSHIILREYKFATNNLYNRRSLAAVIKCCLSQFDSEEITIDEFIQLVFLIIPDLPQAVIEVFKKFAFVINNMASPNLPVLPLSDIFCFVILYYELLIKILACEENSVAGLALTDIFSSSKYLSNSGRSVKTENNNEADHTKVTDSSVSFADIETLISLLYEQNKYILPPLSVVKEALTSSGHSQNYRTADENIESHKSTLTVYCARRWVRS
nr:unnamed protein product [Spirometra erinaceieuropaei]